jgi:hypothetical protein
VLKRLRAFLLRKFELNDWKNRKPDKIIVFWIRGK